MYKTNSEKRCLDYYFHLENIDLEELRRIFFSTIGVLLCYFIGK